MKRRKDPQAPLSKEAEAEAFKLFDMVHEIHQARMKALLRKMRARAKAAKAREQKKVLDEIKRRERKDGAE